MVEDFDVVPSHLPEEASADPWETASRLASLKAEEISASNPEAIVIGADTVVAYEDGGWIQLAKPIDEIDAARMLRALAGREHVVITGVSVVGTGFASTVTDTTRVRFRALSDEEIAEYVRTGESLDKAGAYAIQGGAKGFVESIEGSLSNVIGLPLEVLGPILDRALAHGIPT